MEWNPLLGIQPGPRSSDNNNTVLLFLWASLEEDDVETGKIITIC